MGFMRRKSVAAADAEDNRPRNRLSKPMTSKSPSNQRTTSGKQSPRTESQNTSVSSQLTLSDIAKEPDVYTEPQPIVLESEDNPPPTPPKEVTKKLGVATLVKKFENAASNSQSSLSSSSASQRPLSSTAGSKRLTLIQQQHLHDTQSRERLASHKRSRSTLTMSPTDSLERLVDPFTIPKRRESKYRPGEATRKPSAEDKENQPPVEEMPPHPTTNKLLPTIQAQEQHEIQPQKWTPPPPIGRSGTPSSLEPKAIGNLRLGSLHIVNGRSSPVLSELSRQLISRQLRDVSSEYADSIYSKDLESDAWEDADVVEDADDTLEEIEAPTTPTRAPVEDQPEMPCVTPRECYTPVHRKPLPRDTAVKTPDRTSIMAQSYISELRGSPFSYGTASPVSPLSPISTISTESILHQPKDENSSAPEPHFDQDETDNRRVSLTSEQLSIESELQTVVSAPSVAETARTRDQIFSSALEFQAPYFQPPPSPQRGFSPQSSRRDSISRPSEHADSGYHSSNSIRSFDVKDPSVEIGPTPLRIEATPVNLETAPYPAQSKGQSPTSQKKEQSPRKLGRFFPIRSAARSSPVVDRPVQTTMASPSKPAAVAPTTKVAERSKQKTVDNREFSQKPQKKLHKLRPHSKGKEPQEIVVQRLASCESTLDLPAIPDAAKANLQLRSQQVPELEKTYTSQHHIKNKQSSSMLAPPATDIRFPSPMPSFDDDEDCLPRNGKRSRSRARDRSRSKSRRRSFLDMFRSEKDVAKRDAEARHEDNDTSIADFGDVLRSLGANPYDIAHSQPQSQKHRGVNEKPNVNPHNVSSNAPRKRMSMNDEEAAEYARVRSHSLNHGDKNRRAPSFDDRGDFYDRLRRMSMTEEEVPPMPPLPNPKELRRISQRYSLQSQQIATPTREQQGWEMSPASHRQLESSPAPLPPAHSPRPSFVDHEYEADHPVEDDIDMAPPPPSHSPIPMNVPVHHATTRSPQPTSTRAQREPENTWEAQARAWRARRKSAGEALEHHRRSREFYDADYGYADEAAIDDDDGLVYPVIPPRDPGRDYQPHQQHYVGLPGDNYHYAGAPPEFHPQRSHTWDNNGHDPYRIDQERPYNSRSSYEVRQQRHNTWTEPQEYEYNNGQAGLYQETPYANSRPRYRSQHSSDSRHSFYSHHNRPIDRPFDEPQTIDYESEDEHERYNGFYPPQPSPMRGRERQRQEYDYNQPHGYERQYHQPYYDEYQPQYYAQEQYQNGYAQPPRRQPRPQPQQQNYRPSPNHSQRNSFIPHPPHTSRPVSRHSQLSNASAVSLAEELHPDIEHRPSQAPDYGRYSGGMGFGYEGRGKGFGGSAGTRSVSGKANAMFKGTELRGSHGVDLGDVPVIGVMKKV